MTIRDLCEPEICGLQAILPDIIKNAAPLPANVLKKMLTIINDEQESRRERAKFGDWVKSSAEQIKKEQPTDEINPNDIVRLKSNTPREYYAGIPRYYRTQPFEVFTTTKKSGGEWMADITSCDGFVSMLIPVRFLEPYYSAEDVRRMEEDLQREKEQFLSEHSGKDDKPKGHTITIPVKADYGEDVGFALLDKAFELQKNYTELEGEIKRLYELVNDAMNGLHPLRLAFDNSFLGSIANMIYSDFRPLTEEEKAQFLIDIKNMANNLKKQSE